MLRNIGGLDVSLTLYALLGLLDKLTVIRVPFGHEHLLAQNVFAGPNVAVEIDSLDVDARPLLDDETDIDSERDWVPANLAAHTGKREALIRGCQRELFDALIKPQAVEHIPALDKDFVLDHGRIESG